MPHPANRSSSEPSAREADAVTPLVDDALAGERPLPPLPDGGLTASMPEWLRAIPVDAARTAEPLALAPAVSAPSAASEPIDPTTFVTESDLPTWIRALVAGGPSAPGKQATPSAPEQRSRERPVPQRVAPSSDAIPAATPLAAQPATHRTIEESAEPAGGEPSSPPAMIQDTEGAAAPNAARSPAERSAPSAARPQRGPTRARLDAVAISLALLLLLLALLAILSGSGALP